MLSAHQNCPGELGFLLFDEEVDTYPELRSIRVRSVRITRRHPTIARVGLVYGYVSGAVRAWATVALTHEPGGWRLALPEPLSPRAEASGDGELSVRQVRRHLAVWRAGARRVRARERNRSKATRQVLTGSTGCPGSVSSAVDPQRDVTLAIDDDPARRQDDAAVDLVGASQSWTAGRVCFELRFRTPLAAEVNFELWLLQRVPIRGHPVVSEAVRVELTGTTAVAMHEMVGRRWFGVDVRVSPARDSVAVEVGGWRGWGIIEPSWRYRWAVDVWRALPEINNGYRDVLEP